MKIRNNASLSVTLTFLLAAGCEAQDQFGSAPAQLHPAAARKELIARSDGLPAPAALVAGHCTGFPAQVGVGMLGSTGDDEVCDSMLEEVDIKAEVGRIEDKIDMPPGAAKVDKYVRYYALAPDHVGHIVGIMIEGHERGEVRIVPFAKLPVVLDGGCSVIRVLYEVSEERIIRVWCAGTT